MGKIPGVNSQRAARAFERAGFRIIRQSGHIVMWDGVRTIVIPRNDPIAPVTMFKIVRSAGLTAEQFRELL
jgi:predicted RNA binding protein YcfA (HicA-like mRNA interferase family)